MRETNLLGHQDHWSRPRLALWHVANLSIVIGPIVRMLSCGPLVYLLASPLVDVSVLTVSPSLVWPKACVVASGELVDGDWAPCKKLCHVLHLLLLIAES